jgi:uncharacterized protein
MSSETLHAPRERLSRETIKLHQAVASLIEELEAVDWYRQRADDCEDEQLKGLLLHNMREEMEHASMLLEWIRRNNADFAGHLKEYLFTEKPILEVEEAETKAERTGNERPRGFGFTVGRLKED